MTQALLLINLLLYLLVFMDRFTALAQFGRVGRKSVDWKSRGIRGETTQGESK
jgi:hypothetical protein